MNVFFFYLVTWRHLLSGALLGLCGYTLGGGAAFLARMSRPQVCVKKWYRNRPLFRSGRISSVYIVSKLLWVTLF